MRPPAQERRGLCSVGLMPAAHQDAGGGQHQHQHFEDGDDAQQPLLATRQGKRQLGEADDGQARQDDDAHKVADVALADEGQPAPALRDAAGGTVIGGAAGPQARQVVQGDLRGEDCLLYTSPSPRDTR